MTAPVPPSPARRRWPTVLAVGVAVLAVVVVVWLLVVRSLLGDDAGSNAAPSAEPTPSVEPSTVPSSEPSVPPSPTEASSTPSAEQTAGAQTVTLWFAGEHEDTRQSPALYPEPAEATGSGEPVQVAVDALLATLPVDPDYANAFWDAASEDAGRTPATATVTVSTDGTDVDLGADAFSVGVGSEYAALGVEQLVRTVLSNGGSAPVRITVDGATGAEVWGVLALEDAYDGDDAVVSASSIVSVRDGDTVTGPVTLAGTGFGFEGELDVLAIDEATGDAVEQTFVAVSGGAELTEDGAPVPSDYTIDLDLAPGTYRLVVADANEGGDGVRWTSYDDKVVTVG